MGFIRYLLLDTGYWILGTRYWRLDAGYWILDTGRWLLVAGCWVLDAQLNVSELLQLIGNKTVSHIQDVSKRPGMLAYWNIG
jgi:hypothetical protein